MAFFRSSMISSKFPLGCFLSCSSLDATLESKEHFSTSISPYPPSLWYYLISRTYYSYAIWKTVYINLPLKTYSDRQSRTILYAMRDWAILLSLGNFPFSSSIFIWVIYYLSEILISRLMCLSLAHIVSI